jgi:hypothetical protein
MQMGRRPSMHGIWYQISDGQESISLGFLMQLILKINGKMIKKEIPYQND